MIVITDLSRKTIVITGAGGVLCSAFAKALSACGAKLALLDINLDAVQKVADEINQSGCRAVAVQCNVLDKADVIKAEEAVFNQLGLYNILINGAGGNNPRANTANEVFSQEDADNPNVVSFFDLDIEGVNFVFQLNFMGTLIPTQVFAKRLIGAEGACIINMSSMSAQTPLTKVPAYGAAKAAVDNLTAWLSVHFANTGLRVNALAPGFFLTNQNKGLLINQDGSLTPRSQKILAHTPMKRFGEVDDLMGALIWLCDDTASGFVTGTVVPIDGGFSRYTI